MFSPSDCPTDVLCYRYPTCLKHLSLLKQPMFRLYLKDVGTVDELHNQEIWHWATWYASHPRFSHVFALNADKPFAGARAKIPG